MVKEFILGGQQYRINSDGSSVTVTGSEEDFTGALIISPWVQYEGKSHKVTKVGERAFEDCVGLTTVKIPGSVTEIGKLAFAGCRNTVIPNSVTEIANKAFCYCTGLFSVRIPQSVTEISNLAFCGCSSLASIIVECGNTRYDSRDNCNAIVESSTNTLLPVARIP